MSKIKLQKILKDKLGLEAPIFKLEKIGDKWAGSIISPTFRRMRDRVRQGRIWRALESELGPKANFEVGTLLAYTPEEWNIDLPAKAG